MGEQERLVEQRLRELANQLDYPPTPDIESWVADELAGKQPWRFQHRPLAWTAAATLFVLVVLLVAVPGARATLAETVRIGAVRIFLGPEAASRLATPRPTLQVPARSTPTGTPLPDLDFEGETTLARAGEEFPFPIELPSYPPDLGEPDRVFLQEQPAPALISVWLDSQGNAELALFQLTPSAVYSKLAPKLVQRTIVNGEPALWTAGPYLVEVEGQGLQERRLIEGHVLIWSGAGVTYRLETDLPLAEAVQVAESLE